MSRFIIKTIEGAGYDPVYTIAYNGRVLCTLSIEAEAKEVVIALEYAYTKGFAAARPAKEVPETPADLAPSTPKEFNR